MDFVNIFGAIKNDIIITQTTHPLRRTPFERERGILYPLTKNMGLVGMWGCIRKEKLCRWK